MRQSEYPGAARPLPGPLREFAAVALAGLTAMLALQAALFDAGPGGWLPALAIYVVAATLAGALFRRHYPHAVLGWCNAVTLGRLALATCLVTPLLGGSPAGWAVAGLGAVALGLDGIDGWLARRQRLVSDFGARFDMEVDAALALILALHALAGGVAGPLVLVLGLARYGFVLAALALPWLRTPLPERLGRKAVCVAQLATLIALQVPGIGPALSGALVPAMAAALAWSFGRDVLWLWRRRG